MRRTHSLYMARPAAFDYEQNDCAVRALMVAADVPYATAHGMLKDAGRKDRQGTWNHTMDAVCAAAFLPPVVGKGGCEILYRPGKRGRAIYPTIAQFAREHPRGRFVLRLRRHFAALVDGVLHERVGGYKARGRVMWAWGK